MVPAARELRGRGSSPPASERSAHAAAAGNRNHERGASPASLHVDAGGIDGPPDLPARGLEQGVQLLDRDFRPQRLTHVRHPRLQPGAPKTLRSRPRDQRQLDREPALGGCAPNDRAKEGRQYRRAEVDAHALAHVCRRASDVVAGSAEQRSDVVDREVGCDELRPVGVDLQSREPCPLIGLGVGVVELEPLDVRLRVAEAAAVVARADDHELTDAAGDRVDHEMIKESGPRLEVAGHVGPAHIDPAGHVLLEPLILLRPPVRRQHARERGALSCYAAGGDRGFAGPDRLLASQASRPLWATGFEQTPRIAPGGSPDKRGTPRSLGQRPLRTQRRSLDVAAAGTGEDPRTPVALRRAASRTTPAIPLATEIAAITPRASRYASSVAVELRGEPRIAISTATPTASPICRNMLTTAEPVANEWAGSDEVPVAIIVGSVNPTPTPVSSIPPSICVT